MNSSRRNIFIIAGEPSGDTHGADLVRSLHALERGYAFIGIGGERMREAGVSLLYHMSQLAFLGITEIIRHLPFLRKVMNHVQEALSNNIEAIILVDYPGFNLRVARIAKRLNVPVIYFICPQLWAWGEKRVEKIRRYVDLPLVIFRFEKEFFAKHGIDAHFIGHPLVDQISVRENETEFRRRYAIPGNKPILALLPGSRQLEVEKLLPVMLTAGKRMVELYDCVLVLGRTPQLEGTLYDQFLEGDSTVLSIQGDTHSLMKYAYTALVASGTATLELAYLNTPMLVLYIVAPLTYMLGKRLVKIDMIALANIVSGMKVVPECIQHEVTPENVIEQAGKYFQDPEYYRHVSTQLARIPDLLGGGGAARRAAEKIDSFLGER